MRARHASRNAALLGAVCAAGLLLACNSGTGAGNAADAPGSTGLSATGAAGDGGTPAASASGPLLCTPSSTQTRACTGLAVGAACTLTRSFHDHDGDADDDAGVLTIAGTCRSTFDGTGVACVPNPPAPPSALTGPCSGKAAGDACEVQGPLGGTFQGACVDPRGSGTLFCGRARTPPQPLIDACGGKTAGDACALGERRDGGTFAGVCGNGPAGAGPLACAPNRDHTAKLAAACTGLDAGTACTLGKGHWDIDGTCTTPAGGGAALCLPACGELRHRFQHHPWWHRDPHHPWEPPVPMGGKDAGG